MPASTVPSRIAQLTWAPLRQSAATRGTNSSACRRSYGEGTGV